MTFLPSATALLAASLASPAATDTLENSLSKASMAEFLVWLAGRAIAVYYKHQSIICTTESSYVIVMAFTF